MSPCGLLSPRAGLWLLAVLCPLACVLALGAGRYDLPLRATLGILAGSLTSPPGADPGWTDVERTLVFAGRLPRVLLAALVGAGLAASGAALQAIFRNPLADPQLIGVSAGAACGGVIGILLDGHDATLAGLALAGGLGALGFVRWLAGGVREGQDSVLTLILAGVVVSAVFGAVVALAKFVAHPQSQLPAMVFWLLGSLAGADYARLTLAAASMAIGGGLLWRLRFALHVMSLGEEDACALGLPVQRVRAVALFAVALMTAVSVASCGVIGWVGLVVPHLVRLLFGMHYASFLPLTALLGALYLLGVDTAARSVADAEIPLGALTALAGAPLFAWLLRRMKRETPC